MKIYNHKEITNKEKLNYFAQKAKNEISLNNFYHKKKEIYQNYIKEIKSILFDKDNIKKNFIILNNRLKSSISKLEQSYNKIKSNKYDIYYKKCTDELDLGKPLINQLKSDNFTLRNTLIQRDFEIKVLTDNLKSSKVFTLFRQPKRDIFTELKEGNFYIKNFMNKIQANLLTNCKSYNALIEKEKNQKIKITKLKEKIEQILEFIYLINKEKSKKNIIYKPLLLSNDSKKIISNPNIIINLKNFDRTFSSNESTQTTSKKSSNNKDNISNSKFELYDSEKKYLEDIKYTSNNNNNNINTNITKAIKKIIIQEPINKNNFKSLSINPIMNCETLKNEIDIPSSKYSNSNINSEDNNIYNFIHNKALSAENRKTKKSKNKKNVKIIQSFLNLEELFQITDSENEKEEIIIDTVIHSDDETVLEKKVIHKKSIESDYSKKVQCIIPKINLDLIEFNKLKVYQEIDLYSLQRRNYKNMDVEDNIKLIKKKIKKMSKKVEINSKKLEVMNKFINELKNKYALFKRIKTQSSAINSKVNYISGNEIIDLDKVEEEESENDIGSDYLNEDDEISESKIE